MLSSKSVFLLAVVGLLKLSTAAPVPDSAGIVEMVNGLAYGGIPYGSVTGMVAKYTGFPQQQLIQARQLSAVGASRPVIVTPNFRATRLIGVHNQHQPVQIYNVPGVVAPGVIGTISQIGY